MKIKPLLTNILILLTLTFATFGAYRLAVFLPRPILPISRLPPLFQLNLPSQTQNDFTASVEAYYADATRLVFQVRLTGSDVIIDQASIKDETGDEINVTSTGFGRMDENDPALNSLMFEPAIPLNTDQFKGKLDFSIVSSTDENKILARFSFNIDIPIHPTLTYLPKQTVWANGLEILLDRIVITPAYTQAYLCYIKPTDADWMIGNDATVKFGNQEVGLDSYSILFDPAYGDGIIGGEPGWTLPVQTGRCVKVRFPIGDENPNSLTLTIPSLMQSLPEIIPAEELAPAYEKLKAQGIDMEWHIVDHGAYPEYKRLPTGMSEQVAYQKFIGALGYIHPGPWVFNLQLKSQEMSQPVFSTSSYGAATPIPLSISEPRVAATVSGKIHSFNISPDHRTVALATSQGVFLYDLGSYQLLHTLDEGENVFSVAWSPDGTKLAAGGIFMRASENSLPHLVVWEASTWKVVFERKDKNEVSISFGALAWSPDGHSLAFAQPERGLVAVNLETGETISQQKDFLTPPYNVAWSPDGTRLIATGDLGFGFRRWRVNTDQAVRLYDPRAGAAAFQLAWSPDGTRIASGHGYGIVCFWTVSTNQCDGLIYAHQNMVSSLAWSPDGSQLATGVGVIRIWDTHTGQLFTAFGLNDKSIYTHLEWLDPKTLVSLETGYAGKALTIVRFWDIATGTVLFEFQGESSSFGE